MNEMLNQRLEFVSTELETHNSKYHPGLLLDKLILCIPDTGKDSKEDKQKQKDCISKQLNNVVNSKGDSSYFQLIKTRHQKTLKGLGGQTWAQELIAPMALHLARAALLENANVCLHRTYGFAYLPGSGLKGLARAWAITTWLPKQADPITAWQAIARVFGTGNNHEWQEVWKQYPKVQIQTEKKLQTDCIGAVTFHDAWPNKWPELMVDVLAPHHGDYYSSKGEKIPGDWEDPIPVNFLTIKPGVAFDFHLSPTQGMGTQEDLNLARQFLESALCTRGAGGKTSAGYGMFDPAKGSSVNVHQFEDATTFRCELELITPAFLAGADPSRPEGCDLRGSTLRGQLRWWWRTLHTGHLSGTDLYKLESALWGSASTGGAIGLSLIASDDNPKPILAPFKEYIPNERHPLNPDKKFLNKHGISSIKVGDITHEQYGLIYLAYGMDEFSNKERVRKVRYCLEAPANWQLTFQTRSTSVSFSDKSEYKLDQQEVLDQALSALKLLSQFGGVGARSRKGFGSLKVHDDSRKLSVLKIKDSAAKLRSKFDNILVRNPNPDNYYVRYDEPFIVKTNIKCIHKNVDSWKIMDMVGKCYIRFASKYKHKKIKTYLGLPRQIHGPKDKPIGHQTSSTHETPIPLKSQGLSGKENKLSRHSAPYFIHVDCDEKNIYSVNILFLYDHLIRPENSKENKDEWNKFMEELKLEIIKEVSSAP
ncbi:MAG: type III-B CRISPR module RAMP protein Cmr6 [Candidatus Sumerlaeia bacterium]|nr:type III-B CRISPR module RAMP protein Cmr6 [Candidatus Sumerlaeia bacterium]